MSQKLLHVVTLLSCLLSVSELAYGVETECVNNLYVENNAWFTITIKVSGKQNWEETRTGRLPSGKTFCVIPGDKVEISSTPTGFLYRAASSTIPEDGVLKIVCSGSLIGASDCIKNPRPKESFPTLGEQITQ